MNNNNKVQLKSKIFLNGVAAVVALLVLYAVAILLPSSWYVYQSDLAFAVLVHGQASKRAVAGNTSDILLFGSNIYSRNNTL